MNTPLAPHSLSTRRRCDLRFAAMLACAASAAAQAAPGTVPPPPLTPPTRLVATWGPSGPGGVFPIGVAQGTLNGATPLAFVTADANSNTATVRVPSAATSSLSVVARVAMSLHPKSASLADVDLDGDGDLVVSCNGSGAGGGGSVPASIEVMLQTNASPLTFVRSASLVGGLTTTLFGSCQAVGDVTGDALPDIVAVSPAPPAIVVFRNLGGGTFGGPFGIPLAITPVAVTLFDFNQDGTLDIAVAGSGGVQTVIATPAVPARFTAPSGVAPTTNGAFDITVADLNGDGYPDLATASQNAIDLFLVVGGGPFFVTSIALPNIQHLSIASADFDRDARVDLAVTDATNSGIVMVRNVGNAGGCPGFPGVPCPAFVLEAHFQPALPGPSPGPDLAVADVNQDGSLDVVVTAASTDSTSALVLDTGIRAYSAPIDAHCTGFGALAVTNPVNAPNAVAVFATATSMPPGANYVIAWSPNSGPAGGAPFGGSGCTLWVDTAALFVVQSGVVPASGTVVAPVNIVPASPALYGIQAMFQTGVGAGLTNAVLTRIGT